HPSSTPTPFPSTMLFRSAPTDRLNALVDDFREDTPAHVHQKLLILAGLSDPSHLLRKLREIGVIVATTGRAEGGPGEEPFARHVDRKSTRLNSSHLGISY